MPGQAQQHPRVRGVQTRLPTAPCKPSGRRLFACARAAPTRAAAAPVPQLSHAGSGLQASCNAAAHRGVPKGAALCFSGQGSGERALLPGWAAEWWGLIWATVVREEVGAWAGRARRAWSGVCREVCVVSGPLRGGPWPLFRVTPCDTREGDGSCAANHLVNQTASSPTRAAPSAQPMGCDGLHVRASQPPHHAVA